MFLLAKRNIKLYFRDKSAVFFSLLAAFITLGLYVFFLGDMMSESLENSGLPNANLLIQTWTMAGILAVTSFTTTLGAFSTMIEDKNLKIDKDFFASPLKNFQILGGYIISAYVVGVIMTTIVLIASQAYLLFLGGEMLSVLNIFKTLGTVLLSNAMNTAVIAFIVSFVKTMPAFSGLSTVIGTLIGFLTGIYVPIGNLPDVVQSVIKVFPVSQTAALYRQILMDNVMQDSFQNLPSDIVSDIKQTLGITFELNGTILTQNMHYFIIIGFFVLFYVLTLVRLRSRKTN